MTLEERVAKLEKNYALLATSFLGAQSNQVPITAKVDDSANKIVELTPYTETKTAYIGDTEIVFSDVPSGNLNVFFTNYFGIYRTEILGNRIIVSFEPLEEVTEITISIS